MELLVRDGQPALPVVPDDTFSVTAAADAAASWGSLGLFFAAAAFDPDGAVRAAKLRASLLDTVVIADTPRVLGEMFNRAADGLLVELANWNERSSRGENA